MTTHIAIGDAREMLKTIGTKSINATITSSPYLQQRDYQGGVKEIGRETAIAEYIENLMQVFDQVYRVLKPNGTLFLNIGDTYAPNKSLCLIPQRIALALVERDWIIRNDIIWYKPNAMPESVKDRFTVDYESVLFCVKSPNYYYRQQFRPYSEKTLERCKRYIENGEAFDPARHKLDPTRPNVAPAKVLGRIAKNLIVPGRTTHGMHNARANGNDQEVFNSIGSHMRCVWEISTASYRGAHFAVFPEELVQRCIEAGCPPGGTVLDPFLGSGTVAVVAERLGRTCYGIELNPAYAEQARQRIVAARLTNSQKATSTH